MKLTLWRSLFLVAALALDPRAAGCGEIAPRQSFNVVQVQPDAVVRTWVETAKVTTKVEVEIPPQLDLPSIPKETTSSRSSFLGRRVDVVQVEGVEEVRFTFLAAQDLGVPKPPSPVEFVDIGSEVRGRTFRVNCETSAVVNEGGAAPTTEHIALVRGECDGISRLRRRSAAFSGIQVGETRSFTSGSTGPFPWVLEQFGIPSLDVTLESVEDGPTRRAHFSLRGIPAAPSPTAQSFEVFTGEMTLDETGSVIDLKLEGISKPSVQKLPDGKSEIISKATVTIVIRQTIGT